LGAVLPPPLYSPLCRPSQARGALRLSAPALQPCDAATDPPGAVRSVGPSGIALTLPSDLTVPFVRWAGQAAIPVPLTRYDIGTVYTRTRTRAEQRSGQVRLFLPPKTKAVIAPVLCARAMTLVRNLPTEADGCVAVLTVSVIGRLYFA
jgi:hypothetical protein